MSYSLLNNQSIPEGIYLAMGGIDYAQDDLHILEEEEIVEYKAIKNKNRKSEFINTRHLVKSLADKFGLLDSDFRIKKDDMGKPYGETHNEHIYLSIAHSSHYIICGLSESRDLGIDLEPVDRKVHEGLKSRIFHPDEEDEIRTMELIRVWTIKESLVKLYGCGLRTNLNDLQLIKVNESEFSAIFNNDKSARICSFQHNEHWVSVAYYK
ncbi:MAG: 4'-phosphopantetheinyl transferase family protein [Candidatus Cyclobacteriaceae bacterium M2_1C_046]